MLSSYHQWFARLFSENGSRHHVQAFWSRLGRGVERDILQLGFCQHQKQQVWFPQEHYLTFHWSMGWGIEDPTTEPKKRRDNFFIASISSFRFSADAFATNGMNSSSYASFKAGKFADNFEKLPELFFHQSPDLDGRGWRQNSTTNGSIGHRFPHTWRQ